jgi:hypothetical protein
MAGPFSAAPSRSATAGSDFSDDRSSARRSSRRTASLRLGIFGCALWRGGPQDWANESYGIAASVIYKRLPDADGMLPMSYEAEVLPIMNEQLQRAGVRLAAALNAALKSSDIEGSRIESPAAAK